MSNPIAFWMRRWRGTERKYHYNEVSLNLGKVGPDGRVLSESPPKKRGDEWEETVPLYEDSDRPSLEERIERLEWKLQSAVAVCRELSKCKVSSGQAVVPAHLVRLATEAIRNDDE